MGCKKRTFIDDMVDQFGYDYVIGYCLCNEYNLKKLAENENDPEKKEAFIKNARRSKNCANNLMKERLDNGL